jgi:hypothetical protein
MPPADVSSTELNELVDYLVALTPSSRLPFEPQVGPRKPPSHFSDTWYIDHKFEVRKDPTQCAKCHAPSFCQSCHRNRRPDSHLRDWLKYHFGTARENPDYCRVCHAKKFCDACHAKLLHTPDWLPAKHGRAALAQPGICDNCHRRVMCTTCHAGTPPSTHKEGWKTEHGAVALKSTTVCWTCHNEQGCASCHGLKMPHGTGWLHEHGPRAMATPSLCTQCHTAERRRCLECHTNKPPAFHTPVFRKSHSQMGAERANLCEQCHGKNSCLSCHGIQMPHPAAWMGTHKDFGATFKPDGVCFRRCHQKAFCAKCHSPDEMAK